MPLLLDTKRETNRLAVSTGKGAGVTLIAGIDEYQALFGCASKCAAILGSRELEELGDGILESIPRYRIPLAELFHSITRLSVRYSVALVDYTFDKHGGRFVCLWRITPTGANPAPEEPVTVPEVSPTPPAKHTFNADEF